MYGSKLKNLARKLTGSSKNFLISMEIVRFVLFSTDVQIYGLLQGVVRSAHSSFLISKFVASYMD